MENSTKTGTITLTGAQVTALVKAYAKKHECGVGMAMGAISERAGVTESILYRYRQPDAGTDNATPHARETLIDMAQELGVLEETIPAAPPPPPALLDETEEDETITRPPAPYEWGPQDICRLCKRIMPVDGLGMKIRGPIAYLWICDDCADAKTFNSAEVTALRGWSRQRINTLILEGRLTPEKGDNGRLIFDAEQVRTLEIRAAHRPEGATDSAPRTRRKKREILTSKVNQNKSL